MDFRRRATSHPAALQIPKNQRALFTLREQLYHRKSSFVNADGKRAEINIPPGQKKASVEFFLCLYRPQSDVFLYMIRRENLRIFITILTARRELRPKSCF